MYCLKSNQKESIMKNLLFLTALFTFAPFCSANENTTTHPQQFIFEYNVNSTDLSSSVWNDFVQKAQSIIATTKEQENTESNIIFLEKILQLIQEINETASVQDNDFHGEVTVNLATDNNEIIAKTEYEGKLSFKFIIANTGDSNSETWNTLSAIAQDFSSAMNNNVNNSIDFKSIAEKIATFAIFAERSPDIKGTFYISCKNGKNNSGIMFNQN